MIQKDKSNPFIASTKIIKEYRMPSQEAQKYQSHKQNLLPIDIEEFMSHAKNAQVVAKELNNYDENQKIVFLIGNTRAGKSSLFHLLKGDELIINENRKYDIKEQLPSLIGHRGMAKTQSLNRFENNNKIVFVDTPGLHDTDDGYQEIVSQLNLQREMNKYQNVYILVVAYYDTRSNNELQDILRVAQKLFHNKDHFDKLKDNIRLVITQSTKDKYSMVCQMEKIFKEILQNYPDYRGKEILEHFLQNSPKIIFFKKNANSNEQDQLRVEIEQFIEQIEHQKHGQNNQVQNYQLIISYKGKLKINKFLQQLIYFYKEKLTSVFNKINQQLNESNEIQNNYFVCQLIYNLNDKLYLDNVFQFQTELYQILKEYQFGKCIDKELNQIIFLFGEYYVQQMLQIQEKNYNSEIKMDQAFENFQNSAQKVAQRFQKIQIDKSQEWIQYFNSMFKAYQKFIKLKDWKKLVVIIGNRLSGKSKALNLLYQQKKFTENYMEQQNGIIESYIDKDFVSLQQINQDVVIEIKELQIELLPFLEFCFKTAIDKKSLFVIGLVLNGTERAEDKVFQTLNHFLESNYFDNLKIIKNYKIISHQLNYNGWIKLIPNLKQLNFYLQNTCCQIVEKLEKTQIDKIDIFNDAKLKKIISYNKKHKLIGFEWWLKYLNQYLTKFHKIASKNFIIWVHSKSPDMKNLILVGQLNPDDGQNIFNQKLEVILQNYRPEISIKVPGKNFQTLQNLFKYLVEQKNLENNINSAFQQITDIKHRLNEFFKMLDTQQESLTYEIFSKIFTLQIIIEFFPKLLDSYEKSELEEKLVCIKKIINDIYQFDEQQEFIIQQRQRGKKNKTTKNDIDQNIAESLNKEVELTLVFKQIKKINNRNTKSRFCQK